MKKPIDIAIIGPESTGKSSLAEALKLALNADVVYEYAREYLYINGAKYTLADINTMAEIQWQNEQELKIHSSYPFRIFDTNLDVIRVWQEEVFNTCDMSILKNISKQRYDFYLLCYPDLEWQYDPLRELPNLDDRLRLFNVYLEIIIDTGIPYYIVKGIGDERHDSAIKYLKAHAHF